MNTKFKDFNSWDDSRTFDTIEGAAAFAEKQVTRGGEPVVYLVVKVPSGKNLDRFALVYGQTGLAFGAHFLDCKVIA